LKTPRNQGSGESYIIKMIGLPCAFKITLEPSNREDIGSSGR
jgi:hypothetical protein